MKKERIAILSLLFIFLIGNFYAQSSSTRADFTIAGCDDGTPIYSCSADYRFFCSGIGELIDSFTSGEGCKGANQVIGGYDDCCPAGYVCTDFGCIQRERDCSTYLTEEECINNACVWSEGKCYDSSEFLSCSHYQTQQSCEEDLLNLGHIGLGTDVCGTWIGENEVILAESCRCYWTGDNCTLTYNVTRLITDIGENHDYFGCSKQFTIGDCVSGKQDISWVVTYDDSPTQEDLTKAGCIDGSKSINCGQPIIKLPGFTFTNIVVVLALIAIFYVFYNNSKKKKRK